MTKYIKQHKVEQTHKVCMLGAKNKKIQVEQKLSKKIIVLLKVRFSCEQVGCRKPQEQWVKRLYSDWHSGVFSSCNMCEKNYEPDFQLTMLSLVCEDSAVSLKYLLIVPLFPFCCIFH